MYTVELLDLAPLDGILRKNQLLAAGLVIDQDFVWRYQAAEYVYSSSTVLTQRSVTFDFADAATATFYRLKWT
jgi:hypothetical protein